jgi:hypothetical protein
MAEVVQPGVLQEPAPKKLKVKVTDIITFGIIIVVIVVLAVTLAGKLRLKHDVSSAQTVSDKLITDISKRDGKAALSLGSTKFKQMYTSATLDQQFQAIELVTNKMPAIDRKIRSQSSNGTVVYLIYKYPPHLAGQPYFIRAAITQSKDGTWQLTNIAGSADENNLLVN